MINWSAVFWAVLVCSWFVCAYRISYHAFFIHAINVYRSHHFALIGPCKEHPCYWCKTAARDLDEWEKRNH